MYAIATDELGTTNVAGHPTLGSVSVSPVNYSVNLAMIAPSLFGGFTNLGGQSISRLDGADGVKITTIGEGKLVLAAYDDSNVLVKCKITDDKEASFTAEEIEGATL